MVDKDAIGLYLNSTLPREYQEGYIELRGFSDKERGSSIGSYWIDLSRSRATEIEAATNWASMASTRGFGVFIGYNVRSEQVGTKVSVKEVRTLYADLDIHKTDKTVTELASFLDSLPNDARPNVFLNSGRGVQLVWFLGASTDDKEFWRRVQAGIWEKFKDFGADRAVIKDEARVLRLVGCPNQKEVSPLPVKAICQFGSAAYTNPRAMYLGVIAEHYPVSEETEHLLLGSGLSNLPDEIAEGGTEVYEGRNTLLFKYGSMLRGKGCKFPVIEEFLHSLNQHHCSPPLDSDEIAAIAESVCRYARGSVIEEIPQDAAELGQLITSFGTMERRITATGFAEEIVYGLNRREVGLTQARPNCGKSTTWLNASIALSIGRAFPPLVAAGEPRKVLYIDNENSSEFLNDDLRVMARSLTEEERDLMRSNLFLLVDKEISNAPVNLANPIHRDVIASIAEKIGPDLIVVDTVSASFQLKSENDNSEVTEKVMNPVKALAKRLNCAVMLLHHIGKKREDEDPMFAGRGASAFQALPRLVINITPVTNAMGEVDVDQMEISVTKIKSKPFFPKMRLCVDREVRWYMTSDEMAIRQQEAKDRANALLEESLRVHGGSMYKKEFVSHALSLGEDMTEHKAGLIFAEALRGGFLRDIGNFKFAPGFALTAWRKEIDEQRISVVEGGGPTGAGPPNARIGDESPHYTPASDGYGSGGIAGVAIFPSGEPQSSDWGQRDWPKQLAVSP